MTEIALPPPEILKAREDLKTQVTLEISRPPEGQSLRIYIKAPLVASVVRNMTPGNYQKESYAAIYKPILKELAANPKMVITRPAIAKATRNFVGDVSFDFATQPRAILLCNPEALEEGYTLDFKVETPVAQDQLRKWGKMFMEGCADIITNTRPFRMAWVMNKVE